MRALRLVLLILVTSLPDSDLTAAQQVSGQDIDTILARADKLLEEAKAGYEDAASKGAVAGFIDAGFKLEEARIKYLVLQEIGSADKQKLAADRLRAVNQLSKLIHDGKVAVGGTPAEPAPPKPAEPAPNQEPSAAPIVAPLKAAVDVSKRAAIPDARKQLEAEKQIKDLFKEHYAKKTPAERRPLIRLLLDQAVKSQEDPPALWVLYREAGDLAVQNCDARTALDVIDGVARSFDVDALAMKTSALAGAAKTAKAPEDFLTLAENHLGFLDELVRADLYDAADKTATAAVQLARKSNDNGLVSRSTARAKEISEAKTLYQSMKSAMEGQAKNPDDPASNLEIGRFLCFVKGSWDLGLRFIVKGSDPALKALAEKELSIPAQTADRAALADGWYDLGDKEKSPLRKSQLLAHSKSVYESALADSASLLRARIEKRLEQLKDVGPAGAAPASTAPAAPREGPVSAAAFAFDKKRKLDRIDLLARFDPAKDTLTGSWKLNGRVLTGSPGGVTQPKVEFSAYVPPEEYDLTIVVERKDGSNSLTVVLPGPGGKQFGTIFDWFNGEKSVMFSEVIPGKFFENKTPKTIVYMVRKEGVVVRADGKDFFACKVAWDKVGAIGEDIALKAKNTIGFRIVAADVFNISTLTVTAPK